MTERSKNPRSTSIAELVGFLESKDSLELAIGSGRLVDRPNNNDDGPPLTQQGIDGPWGNDLESSYRELPSDGGQYLVGTIDIHELMKEGSDGEVWNRIDPPKPMAPSEAAEFVRRRTRDSVSRSALPAPTFEAIAWYQPAHFYGTSAGVFMLEEGLCEHAAGIASVLRHEGQPFTSGLWQQSVRIAFGDLYLHEAFHHKIESFGFRVHAAVGTGCYSLYKQQVYSKTYGTDDCLEEALANADAMRRLQSERRWFRGVSLAGKRAVLAYLAALHDASPPGYRRWKAYTKSREFQEGLWRLLSQIREATPVPGGADSDWVVAPQLTRGLLDIDRQVTLLVPRRSQVRVPCLAAPAPPVRVRRVERYIKKEGFHLKKGGKGSHRKFENPGPPQATIILPGTGCLSSGVQHQVAKVLGMSSIELAAIV